MTRIGIVAGVIIILVAAIFFGFRTAARQGEKAEKPAAGSAVSSSSVNPAAPSASGSAPPSPTSPPATTVRRIDPAARQKLLEQIERARSRRAPAGATTPAPETQEEFSKDYIRSQVRALIPLLTECYMQALGDDPTLAGKLVVKFTIGGEPEVGGLVEGSEVDAEQSTIAHAGMVECVRETMYGAEFAAPREGVRVEVRYPFEFRNGPPGQ